MNKTEKELLGIALHLASDKRSHLLYEDCYKWERVKMKEIKKILKKVPHIKFDKKNGSIRKIFKKAGINFTNPSG